MEISAMSYPAMRDAARQFARITEIGGRVLRLNRRSPNSASFVLAGPSGGRHFEMTLGYSALIRGVDREPVWNIVEVPK